MKLKTVENRKTHEHCLTARLTKGEELDYIQAEHLRALHDSVFLPFTYTTERGGTTVLSYDVSDTIALNTYLGARLSLVQFRALMTDVAHAVEVCASMGFSYTEFIFDSGSVYIDAETNHLRLAYVPVAHSTHKRATVIDLLRFIAINAAFVCREDQSCSESLLDFIKRQTVFSLIELKAFIDSGELKRGTGSRGSTASSLDISDFSDSASKCQQASAGMEAVSTGVSPLRGSLGESLGGAGIYDFVKAQAGALSAQETRLSQSLAEQVSFDVADVAAVSDVAVKTPVAAAAGVTNVAVTAPVAAAAAAAAELTDMTVATKPTGLADAMPQIACIVCVSTGERYSLSPSRKTTIGRSKRCDIHLGGNTNISRVHAILEATDEGCFVTDQGTTNKTFIAGRELLAHMTELAVPGEEIVLANERLRLEMR